VVISYRDKVNEMT